jgi:Domain of unknown function (DUF6458)
MGVGASIFLIALGAILAFAVEYDISGLDLAVVGWILMIVGAIGLVFTLLIWGPRQRRGGVVEERRVYDERPPAP